MEFFYGEPIDPTSEERIVKKILFKYRTTPFSQELKKRIYEELVDAKARGEIRAPFKVVAREDASGIHRPYIEVIVETQL